MGSERVRERDEPEQGQLVMPFYLICDVSFSMDDDMAVLNDSMAGLRAAIAARPVVDDVAQICVMSFSDDAQVVVPLGQMSERTIPTLTSMNGTCYGAAFRLLARRIREDVAELSGLGYTSYRPCAFFLTDGVPQDDDWHQVFAKTLTYDRKTGQGMRSHPIFIPFGFRNAPESVLRQLAYPQDRGKWYDASKVSVDKAVAGILDIIMRTVVTAGMSAGAGQPAIVQQLPGADSGITQGNSEYHPDYVW